MAEQQATASQAGWSGQLEFGKPRPLVSWYCNHGSLVAFGQQLLDLGVVETAAELQAYYENPWRWGEKWKRFGEWRNGRATDADPRSLSDIGGGQG